MRMLAELADTLDKESRRYVNAIANVASIHELPIVPTIEHWTNVDQCIMRSIKCYSMTECASVAHALIDICKDRLDDACVSIHDLTVDVSLLTKRMMTVTSADIALAARIDDAIIAVRAEHAYDDD